MSDTDDQLAASLSELAGVVLGQRTVRDLVSTVVALARDTVGGADGVSVCLDAAGRSATSHATDDVVRELDEVQRRDGAGPSIEAMRTGARINVGLEEARTRYPGFAAAAEQRFITAVLAAPLATGDKVLGALNCYSASVGLFADRDVDVAARFARQSSVLLANALTLHEANATNDQLHEALRSRDLIGQAKGILMERRGCSADEAFALLRRTSQRQNRKLTVIAGEVIERRRLDDG